MVDVAKINRERLSSWEEKLNKNHATAIMLIGVGHDAVSGQLNFLVTEDRTDEEILLLLKGAVTFLESK